MPLAYWDLWKMRCSSAWLSIILVLFLMEASYTFINSRFWYLQAPSTIILWFHNVVPSNWFLWIYYPLLKLDLNFDLPKLTLCWNDVKFIRTIVHQRKYRFLLYSLFSFDCSLTFNSSNSCLLIFLWCYLPTGDTKTLTNFIYERSWC